MADEVVKFEPAKLPTPPSKNPSVTTTFVETTSSLKLKGFIYYYPSSPTPPLVTSIFV